MESIHPDTMSLIDATPGRDPALSKTYARKLSELGFLSLPNAPAGVLTALRRSMDVKKTACVLSQ